MWHVFCSCLSGCFLCGVCIYFQADYFCRSLAHTRFLRRAIYILFFCFAQSGKTFPIYFVCNFCCLAINLFCKLFGRIHILSRSTHHAVPARTHAKLFRLKHVDCVEATNVCQRDVTQRASRTKTHLVFHSNAKTIRINNDARRGGRRREKCSRQRYVWMVWGSTTAWCICDRKSPKKEL